ncbi:MAG: tripartite tricarboxylate transporter permease [Nitratireductor sp.]
MAIRWLARDRPARHWPHSGIASFVGAFFATWGLVFLAPQLVKVALLFGPAEYFALFTLALHWAALPACDPSVTLLPRSDWQSP